MRVSAEHHFSRHRTTFGLISQTANSPSPCWICVPLVCYLCYGLFVFDRFSWLHFNSLICFGNELSRCLDRQVRLRPTPQSGARGCMFSSNRCEQSLSRALRQPSQKHVKLLAYSSLLELKVCFALHACLAVAYRFSCNALWIWREVSQPESHCHIHRSGRNSGHGSERRRQIGRRCYFREDNRRADGPDFSGAARWKLFRNSRAIPADRCDAILSNRG